MYEARGENLRFLYQAEVLFIGNVIALPIPATEIFFISGEIE